MPSQSSSTLGHDRQPSVQLKIDAAGGPPSQPTRKLWPIIWRNANFIVSQMAVLVSKSSPVVQTLCIILILLYLIQLSGDTAVRDFLILSPGSLLSPGQWVKSLLSAVTHPFVEFHWYSIAVDILSLSLCGTLIEPLWGQREVIFFFTLISITVSFITSLHYILIYTITTDTGLLFATQIHGLTPFCAAIAVTVKQLLPQSVLIATAFGKLKNDHIPITALLVAIIAHIVNLIEGESVVMFSYGLIVSWIYLRFYQRHNIRVNTGDGSASRPLARNQGDLSDSFAFYTFFPNVIRPIVAIFADAVYRVFARIGLCPDIDNNSNPTYRLLSERLSHDMNHANHHNHHTPRVETL